MLYRNFTWGDDLAGDKMYNVKSGKHLPLAHINILNNEEQSFYNWGWVF